MFIDFKKAVQAQFEKMQQHPLFRVEFDKDKLWNLYLDSFPPGTNNLYKERREYDCNCCKSFIRAVGNMVAVIDGKVVSLFDVTVPGYYQPVADALAKYIKTCTITNVFLHSERSAGTDKNYSNDGKEWNHFYFKIPSQFYSTGVDIGGRLSHSRSTFDVYKRSLMDITPDAIDTVLDLIAQNSLYRGEENRYAVESFKYLKNEYDKLKTGAERDIFAWMFKGLPESVTRIRNTAIGTLLTDLSEGVDLEKAVASFESKVAPTNYKRPTALVSKAMIENARKKVEELGLVSALDRRYATINDITVNNILFADRTSRAQMAGNVFDDLAAAAPAVPKNLDKVEEIGIEKFLSDVVPKAQKLEVFFENRHFGNLVSLIAPVDPEAKEMFKWNNRFSWAYEGAVADSMRQRVAELGGRVDGVLRFTHAWNHPEVGRNASLMDLHVFIPGSGSHKDGCHDHYPSGPRVGWNRRKDQKTRGIQDVDYTNAAPADYIPVENITFPDIKLMPEGKYVFKIHNWNNRQPTTSGFKAEIEFGGQIFQYDHPKPLKHKEWVTLAEVTLKNGVFTIEHKLTSQQSSITKWNLPTQQFHPVNVLMHSPNHWDGQGVGNKHYFFMLQNCLNDGKARGFFNEFLKSELDAHRKVLEIVGSKMQTEESDMQLSGLGFSSTQRNHVLCRVKGSFERVVKVVF